MLHRRAVRILVIVALGYFVALRSLDAIHLASAQTAAAAAPLTALVTYDSRLSEAAVSLGIAVVAPGKTP